MWNDAKVHAKEKTTPQDTSPENGQSSVMDLVVINYVYPQNLNCESVESLNSISFFFVICLLHKLFTKLNIT